MRTGIIRMRIIQRLHSTNIGKKYSKALYIKYYSYIKALHKINVLSCFKMAKLIDTISQRLAARSNRQKQQAKAGSHEGKHRTFETNTGRFSRRAKSIIRSWLQRQKIFNVGCTKKQIEAI